MDTNRHNNAVEEGRLMGCWLDEERKKMKCWWCGEQMWQWPEPTYWMQYGCGDGYLVDGNLVCSKMCVEDYLIEHPFKQGQQLKMF